MRARNRVLLLFLLAGTTAWAQASGEAQKWKETRQIYGGLTSSSPGHEHANPADLSRIPGDQDADRLDAFRNAYDFGYAVVQAGGLNLNRDGALRFASETATGKDPKQAVQTYFTAFHDTFASSYSAKEDENEDREAFVAAVLQARATAEEAHRAHSWQHPASIKAEVYQWAVRPTHRYGAELTEDQAKQLSEEIFGLMAGSGESSDRLRTHKFVALRSLYFFAHAKPSAGGMDLSKDVSLKLARDFVKANNAIVRVELFKSYYRRALLRYTSADGDFHEFKSAIIEEARSAALGAKIDAQGGGGDSGSTPAAAPGR